MRCDWSAWLGATSCRISSPEPVSELVWTVAEFDLAGASVVSNLIDPVWRD